MSTVSQNKKTPQEYAANYPVIASDGFYGPFSVGNISEHDKRILMNVCVKTSKSGDRNAVISYPIDWFKDKPFAYRPGDQINILVENGYIKKAFAAKAKSVTSISAAAVNREVTEAVENIQAEKAVEEVMKEIAQSVPTQTSETQPF